MANGIPVVTVTEVGEYIRHRSCERRFKLGAAKRRLARALPFSERLFNPLDPVLQESGKQREAEWEEYLREGAGYRDLSGYGERPADAKETSWDEFAEGLRGLAVGECAYGREVRISGRVGAFEVEGRVDFVLVRWDGEDPEIRLVECKASRRDRTYHRIQVALYRELVAQALADGDITVGGKRVGDDSLDAVVARIDEATNKGQAILDLSPPPDLDVVQSDIEQLMRPGGTFARILDADLDSLDYQLDSKCDGCVFSVHCFPESARQRRLELLGIDPPTARALRNSGVETIDQLAELDLGGPDAGSIRRAPGFFENLESLRAKARSRRRTLPGGDVDPDSYPVEPLPLRTQSQLPEHELNGSRLVRVYLAVDYDYTENRIGALSAHVTTSEGRLQTAFEERDGRWQPSADSVEQVEVEEEEVAAATRPVRGSNVIRFKTSRWTGLPRDDDAAERELIQGFLVDLVDAIAREAGTGEAPVHFYVWNRMEMSRLVEGCTRAGSELLASLRELLGCRESLEQLIFSCLESEISNRYALGWTGRGLSVLTSLRWFGATYHWRRTVAGREVDLDREFTQDLFDFKTVLHTNPDGSWAAGSGGDATPYRYEVRSRFHDSLPAPYWHALWRSLPDPEAPGTPASLRGAIRRYSVAARPGYLRAYLAARVEALRWIEERVRFKNPEIAKPVLDLNQLLDFNLGVGDAARAALDFLRLDQHVKTTDWISAHLASPASRLSTGRTLPLRRVRAIGRNVLRADIDLDEYDLALDDLEARSGFARSGFVRLSPHSGDPNQGQTVGQLLRGGSTCVLDRIDWDMGQVELSVVPQRDADRYRLLSISRDAGEDVFDNATLDESPSDYVAVRVDNRLTSRLGRHAHHWLDPVAPGLPPQAPIGEVEERAIERALTELDLGEERHLLPDQLAAVVDGLGVRAQLLQGPPGTGKTMTSAAALLARILGRRARGDIVLVGANTHTAVDTLLERVAGLEPSFRAAARAAGLDSPPVRLAKVHSLDPDPVSDPPIVDLRANACAADVHRLRGEGVVVIGGTTSALLKMADRLTGSARFPLDRGGFCAQALVVDEASMMVFPHFLALASLVDMQGEFMLSGDHRQLAPILSHDWEREDRPPTLIYQPFVSAYEAVRRLAGHTELDPACATMSALEYTLRLPPIIRDLIARLYRRDEIELTGPTAAAEEAGEEAVGGPLGRIWEGSSGLVLVAHSERESRQSNAVEAALVASILDAAGDLPEDSVAVMTPHRAQRVLLRKELRGHDHVGIVDTVERLQGNERDVVIFSATVSDPAAIGANVEFILDLNRSNVAFSRAKRRLIVVCAAELLNAIPSEIEHYESAMLWKSLRDLCTEELGAFELDGSTVRVLAARREDT